MIPIVESYLRRSLKHNPACDEYSEKIHMARSVREVFDIALNTPCIEFLCGSVAEGWSPKKEEVWDSFSSYLNGRYSHEGKYSSVMYCGYKGKVLCDKTVFCFLWSDAVINVPKNRLCMVYAAGDGCRVKVTGEGSAFTYQYGGAVIDNTTANGKTFTR